MAGRNMEAVGDQEGHQGEPEHHVEDDGRPDALGPEGEPGIRTADAGLGQQPVAQGRPRSRAARGDMAQREGGHVDPEDAEPAGAVAGQYGVGQLGVGGQGTDLEEDAEDQVGHVDMGQGVDLRPVAGQQREGDVEDEEEDEDGPHAQPDLAPHEGPTRYPTDGVDGCHCLPVRPPSHFMLARRDPLDLTCWLGG